ncbi:MAG TPA: CBS domain-containing protein [Pyrinomonadaceae bacterium]
MVSHRALLKLLTHGAPGNEATVTVREITTPDPLTVSSTTPTLEALEIMRRNRVVCLPVLDDGRLVGIVTSYDFLDASARLFKEQLTTKSKRQRASNVPNAYCWSWLQPLTMLGSFSHRTAQVSPTLISKLRNSGI